MIVDCWGNIGLLNYWVGMVVMLLGVVRDLWSDVVMGVTCTF